MSVLELDDSGATITTCSPLSRTWGTCLTMISTLRLTFKILNTLSPTLHSFAAPASSPGPLLGFVPPVTGAFLALRLVNCSSTSVRARFQC